MESKNGRFLDDAQSLKAIIATLPPIARGDYESYQSRTMEVVFPNRYLVVYTVRQARPSAIELWRFGDIVMERLSGPVAEVILPDNTLTLVSVTPKKVGQRDVYLHIPQSFEFKWRGKDAPKGIQFVPHYAVLVKTKTREHAQVEGHTYCTTMNKFQERFPDVPVRY